MSSSPIEIVIARAISVATTDDALIIDLSDGRTISVPLGWFPRLTHGTAEERSNWRFIGHGEGIHWPDLDEDISVDGLIAGRGSGESQRIIGKVARRTRPKVTGGLGGRPF